MSQYDDQRPRATARHTIDAVAQRLGVDSDVLGYLFSECLAAVLQEAMEASSCTIRGIGKFKLTSMEELALANDADRSLMVFEKTKHQGKNTAFAELKLASRMEHRSAR